MAEELNSELRRYRQTVQTRGTRVHGSKGGRIGACFEVFFVHAVRARGSDFVSVITPAVSNEDAVAKFPKGFTTVKPYLRKTPQPNL